MRRACLVPFVFAAALAVGRPTAAQVAASAETKASFLFTFVKFTTWPSAVLPVDAPLRVCVMGDLQVTRALDRVTKGQTVGGRPLEVRRIETAADATACHLLYVSGLGSAAEQAVVDAVRLLPVLTASDSTSFHRSGGIASFHMARGKLKFAVNTAAAERARVKISARLLSLAVIVEDEKDVAPH